MRNIVRQGESVQPCSRRDSIRPGDLARPASRTLHRAMTTTRRVAMRRGRLRMAPNDRIHSKYASNETYATIPDAAASSTERFVLDPRSIGTVRRGEKKNIKHFHTNEIRWKNTRPVVLARVRQRLLSSRSTRLRSALFVYL